jgi:hypothetical protein
MKIILLLILLTLTFTSNGSQQASGGLRYQDPSDPATTTEPMEIKAATAGASADHKPASAGSSKPDVKKGTATSTDTQSTPTTDKKVNGGSTAHQPTVKKDSTSGGKNAP